MLGLVNRSLRSFLRALHGEEIWQEIAANAGVTGQSFEALLSYDDALTFRMLTAAATRLERPEQAILEDMGQWIVTAQTGLPLRRLLRFGGCGFGDFLHSLEEIPDRTRLALPMVDLPEVRLSEQGAGLYHLHCGGPAAFAWLLMGVIQAMADDYGALVQVEFLRTGPQGSLLSLQVHATQFTPPSRFDLVGDDP